MNIDTNIKPMKIAYKIILVSFLFVGLLGCDKDEAPVDLTVEVNYNNMSGTWKLHSWKGKVLAEQQYCYLVLEDVEHRFELYDNFNSMYVHKETGDYEISGDEKDGFMLTGSYDFRDEVWKNYVIRELTKTTMTLQVEDKPEDVSVYVRTELPTEFAEEYEEEGTNRVTP